MLWGVCRGAQHITNMSVVAALGQVRLGKRCIKGLNMQKEEINLSLGMDSINSDISEPSSTMKYLIQVKISIQIKK